MPSDKDARLSRTLARPEPEHPFGEVCAGGVSRHRKATCYRSALLFFTIPNFRMGGRVRLNAPACRAGVPFEEPTEEQNPSPCTKFRLQEREVTAA
jgi:hypothetical protein